MSGGSYNYAYRHIEQLAEEIRPTTPLRRAFKNHLFKVASACKSIEWVDSGDYGAGDEDMHIRLCLGTNWKLAVLQEAVAGACIAREQLTAAIDSAIERDDEPKSKAR